jgi:hypothetical protein
MATSQQLETIAARVLPDLAPAAALAQTNLFLARVMAAGNHDEVNVVTQHFGKATLQAVLHAPPTKIFDRESWNHWNNHFGMPPAVMPDGFFTVYPWFKNRNRGVKKEPITAALIDHVPDCNKGPVHTCDEI